MCMTYYTVDDLRPGSPGWDVRQFSALAEAIDHYRALPMNGGRVLGMADDAHAYELIRCVRLRLKSATTIFLPCAWNLSLDARM